MKKSELKKLIKSIVSEVKNLRGGPHDDEDSGYDLNDPKHPSWGDRNADKYDRNRTSQRDERGEEDQMLGLNHDDSEPMFEDAKLGVSSMKKASNKKDNTQMGYTDKSITSTDSPKEKTEGKKLPIIKKVGKSDKNHITKKTGTSAIKEDILKMIRESINEMAKTAITLDPSGIVRGGVPIQYRVQDPNSTTGWSLKGYTQKFPDGTPVEAPKNTGANYKKVGSPSQGTVSPSVGNVDSSEEFDTSFAATKRTEDSVAEFIKYNPDVDIQKVSDAVAELNTDETPHNLSPQAIKKAIDKAKDDLAPADDIEPTAKDFGPKSSDKSAYNRLRDRLMKAKMKR